MNISIFGSGSMGLALANVLSDNKHNVLVYARNEERKNEININHTNNIYLNDLKINESIKATSSLKECINYSRIFVIAVPSKEVKDLISSMNNYLNEKVLIINATKGLDESSKLGMQSLIKEYFSSSYIDGIVSILGPGFAQEIIKKHLTCVCAVSNNRNDAMIVQNLFSNYYFRVYILEDVNGAEIASSMKNALAIGSGILKGLGYGENSKAALITRGLKEIITVGMIFGANKNTFLGLTGIGDLILTCNSFESRNFKAGYEIGINNDAKSFLENNQITIEGYTTIKVIHNISRLYNLDLPICEALYRLMYLYEKPSKIISDVMNRPLKTEN